MKYIYPAIFTEEEDGILVDFPDLPSCYTDGATIDEAFENAEDALALALWQMEKNTPPSLPHLPSPHSMCRAEPLSPSYALIHFPCGR